MQQKRGIQEFALSGREQLFIMAHLLDNESARDCYPK